MREQAAKIARESLATKQAFIEQCLDDVIRIAEVATQRLAAGGKVLVFGNGGSAADAQHLAGELVGRFKIEREALPCIALTTDTSIITAWTNDYDFESVYARQVEALATANDLAIGISTSGNAANVAAGLNRAGEIGAFTVGMTGRSGGKLQELCDICLRVPSDQTPRIQECHGLAVHILCELVESRLFG
mgnify:CR=1 FL=1